MTGLDLDRERQGARARSRVGFDTYSECVEKVLDGTVDGDVHRRRDPARATPPRTRASSKVVGDAVLRGAHRRRLLARTTRRCASGSTTRSRRPYDDGNWAKAFELTLGKSGVGHAGAAGAGPLPAADRHPPMPPGGALRRPPHRTRRVATEGATHVKHVLDNFDLVLKAFGYTVLLFLVRRRAVHAAGRHPGRDARRPGRRAARAAATYVTLVRNTPLLIIFVFFSIAAPELDITLQLRSTSTSGSSTSPRSSAPRVVSLTLYTSSFVCEALRSGVNAVPLGQAEAARADRPALRRRDDPGRAAAGAPGLGAAAGQRPDRAAQEHLRRRGRSGWPRRPHRCAASPTTTPTSACGIFICFAARLHRRSWRSSRFVASRLERRWRVA